MSESVRERFLHRDSLLGGFVAADPADSGAGTPSVHALPLRAALMAGCAISVGITAYLGDPSGFTNDLALTRLLRGMALIKGAMALAAVAVVLWRFGRPVAMPVAAGYLLGSWVLVGSTMLVWQLTWIPAAAVLFHVAGLSMLLVSWRER
jgi:hypothetical protein